MGFKFTYLCDLFSNLEANATLKTFSGTKNNDPDVPTVLNWFGIHERRIHYDDTDLLAFLSCLFPERRPDRIYWLQHASLAKIIARSLLFGVTRKAELDQWQMSGFEDLGQCVENVMRQAENPIAAHQAVTLEEIDGALNQIASRCRFSGRRIRRQRSAVDIEDILGSLYRRVSSREAKWLTRMILKSYYPLILPSNCILKQVHFLLPALLHFQDSLEAATTLLMETPLKLFPPKPTPDVQQMLKERALDYLTPQVGIKVGRPEFYKARSIKHCCKMIGQRRMSLERKYDGEYCQIHINLTDISQPITIFSKSGRDSTMDRYALHSVLNNCLRIGESSCKFHQYCIVEGEMVVWSDKDEKILDFHKLRKFVPRSGKFLGADFDSQPKPYEHLMIILYDILLLDEKNCLQQPHRVRRLLLKETVKPICGRAEIAEQIVIDFSKADSQKRLESHFARSIAERWEGLVIKASNEPYFAFLLNQDEQFCRWIKLKKGHIPGLGDTADFSLVGAAYEPKDGSTVSKMKSITWTRFYIGCLENKNYTSTHSRQTFRVIDTISIHNMGIKNLQLLNTLGRFEAEDVQSELPFDFSYVHNELAKMQVAFKRPLVVELLGSGFDRPSNSQYFTLRFPRVLKIHFERTFEDTITFSELQILAERARSVPLQDLSHEMATWSEEICKTQVMAGYIMDKSQGQESTTETSISGPISPVLTTAITTSPEPSRLTISPQQLQTAPCSSQPPSPYHSHSQITKKRALSGISLRAAKRSCSRTSLVSIFTEDVQEVTASCSETGPVNPFLREIENVSCQSSASFQASEISRNRIDKQFENSRLSRKRSVSADTHVFEKTGICYHLDGDTTGNHIVQIDAGDSSRPGSSSSKLAREKPQSVRPSRLPIYADSVSRSPTPLNSSSDFNRPHQSANLIFTLPKFMESLTAGQYTESDSIRGSVKVAVGVIIVNSEDHNRLIARTVCDVANRIVDVQATLPSKGRLFVLEHVVLHDEVLDDAKSLMESHPQTLAKYFYSCVEWGYAASTWRAKSNVVVSWNFIANNDLQEKQQAHIYE